MLRRRGSAARAGERVFDLRGKTCLVTGAASGIGKATAAAFAARGARVVLCDVDGAALEEVAEALGGSAACPCAEAVDVANRDAMAALARKVHETAGPLDVLVNNAGVYLAGSALDLTLEDWDWVLGVNLWGVIYGCHYFLPAMISCGKGGHVVNVASMYGYWPSPGVAGYLTAKFGVFGFSEALREDLRPHGIRVSTVCPGIVRTGLVEKMRIRNGGDAEAVRGELIRMYERRDYRPDHVANAIVKAVAREWSRVELVSGEARLMYRVERYLPSLSRFIARRAARRMFSPRDRNTSPDK